MVAKVSKAHLPLWLVDSLHHAVKSSLLLYGEAVNTLPNMAAQFAHVIGQLCLNQPIAALLNVYLVWACQERPSWSCCDL